ncbi:MAG: site-specific DNA-methyltransferase [Ktedonobacteraceae bacterium]
MPSPITSNTLFYGDNLDILRDYIADQSVDLVYLDPPFNSSRSYNVLFKDESGKDSEAQIVAFEDTWHWPGAVQTYHDLITDGPPHVVELMKALHSMLGASAMMAYLVMMAARLVELHRVLKQTGSLYLHCDPTASHYLKIVLDTIFGPLNYRNEIVWKRTSAHSSAKKYGPVHDVLLFYVKTDMVIWNDIRTGYDPAYLEKYYRFDDGDGRLFWRADLCAAGTRNGRSGLPWRGFDPAAKGMHWKFTIDKLDELDAIGRIYWPKAGGMPQYKRYRDELKGKAIPDVWDDIDKINPVGSERLGYPTQKPLALLERIIAASSNPGDIVLDPFAGCGTAVIAAEKLGRRWIGMDITHLAIALLKYRLKASFPSATYRVIGEPEDLGAARQLAQDDRYQFQWWALSLVQAKPLGGQEGSKIGKKGSDKGIDGVINFIDEAPNKAKRILVQVKSGHVKSGDIRDIVGTIQRESAAIGVFITLEPPTRDMVNEAASAGFYTTPFTKQTYPRLQILTIAELLHGATIKMPTEAGTFKQAQRVHLPEGDQLGLAEL